VKEDLSNKKVDCIREDLSDEKNRSNERRSICEKKIDLTREDLCDKDGFDEMRSIKQEKIYLAKDRSGEKRFTVRKDDV